MYYTYINVNANCTILLCIVVTCAATCTTNTIQAHGQNWSPAKAPPLARQDAVIAKISNSSIVIV